jgi:hypothetical protein
VTWSELGKFEYGKALRSAVILQSNLSCKFAKVSRVRVCASTFDVTYFSGMQAGVSSVMLTVSVAVGNSVAVSVGKPGGVATVGKHTGVIDTSTAGSFPSCTVKATFRTGWSFFGLSLFSPFLSFLYDCLLSTSLCIFVRGVVLCAWFLLFSLLNFFSSS